MTLEYFIIFYKSPSLLHPKENPDFILLQAVVIFFLMRHAAVTDERNATQQLHHQKKCEAQNTKPV